MEECFEGHLSIDGGRVAHLREVKLNEGNVWMFFEFVYG